VTDRRICAVYRFFGGGAGPMGMMGHGQKSGGSKQGLTAPSPLAYDLAEDEEDDW